MWLSRQQKRPSQAGEGQVGKVTIGGEQTAVMLDSERRGLEVYGPGGYRWRPGVGQKVLVIQGRGEIPCVAGVRVDQEAPEEVTVESAAGGKLRLDGADAALSGERVELNGQVYVNGETLEELIVRVVAAMLAAMG